MTDQPKPRAYRLADYDTAMTVITEIRETKGISRTELAKGFGGTRQQLNHWLRGVHEPSGRRMFELFAALGYDLALIPKDAP